LNGFETNNKRIIFGTQNSGHHAGVAEAVDEVYGELCGYDFVVHTHPDVFLVDTTKLENTLLENSSKEVDYIAWQLPQHAPWEPDGFQRDPEYASDFFIFAPKAANNVFKHHVEYWKKFPQSGCERFLYYATHREHLKVARLDRDPHGAMDPSANAQQITPEPFGIWHSHNLSYVKEYIQEHDK